MRRKPLGPRTTSAPWAPTPPHYAVIQSVCFLLSRGSISPTNLPTDIGGYIYPNVRDSRWPSPPKKPSHSELMRPGCSLMQRYIPNRSSPLAMGPIGSRNGDPHRDHDAHQRSPNFKCELPPFVYGAMSRIDFPLSQNFPYTHPHPSLRVSDSDSSSSHVIHSRHVHTLFTVSVTRQDSPPRGRTNL